MYFHGLDGLGWQVSRQGPQLFGPSMRRSAVIVLDGELHVFWTRVGDAPDSILHSTIDVTGDWGEWGASEPTVVLRPEHLWEGADAPIEPSRRSVAPGHVNQLRDPCVFVDEDRTALVAV